MNSEKELIEVLQAIPWFQELSEEHFSIMKSIAEVVLLEKDEMLFRQGDTQDYLYILIEGRVAVELYSPLRGSLRVFTAEPLDVVGWSSATPVVRQRTASARAVLDSRLVALANVVAGRLMICRLQLVDLFGHPEGDDQHA